MNTNWGKMLSQLRRRHGWSQVELAGKSGVSLPSIQNIEAGKANPTWLVVEKLTHAFGWQASVHPKEPAWRELEGLGVPISRTNQKKMPPNWEKHVQAIPEALFIVTVYPDRFPRLEEALKGWLLALRGHYPSLYETTFGKNTRCQHFLNFKIEGKHIKLRNIALSNLSQHFT